MPQLQPGENQIRTASVTWVGPPAPRSGTLTLTNQALIWEGPIPPQGGGMRPGGPMMRPGFRGPMGPMGRGPGWGGPRMMQNGTLRIGLWRCKGATVVPSPQGGGNLLQLQLLSRVLAFQLPEPEAWAASVTQARATAPPPPPGAMGGGPGGPGGTAMPRCEYCDHLSPPGSTKCQSCGAPF